MNDTCKFFGSLLIYFVVALGIYGYCHANNTFTRYYHNAAGEVFASDTGVNSLMAVFWPVAFPVYGVVKVISVAGDYSISLFSTSKAENTTNAEMRINNKLNRFNKAW